MVMVEAWEELFTVPLCLVPCVRYLGEVNLKCDEILYFAAALLKYA